MSDVTVKCVAPWYGSNRMGAERVALELGPCDWIGVPFVGGFAEVLTMKGRTIVANDLHRHVINLARVMADPVLGPTLYRKLRRMVLHPDTPIIAQARCEMREQELHEKHDLFGGVDRNIAKAIDPSPDLMWAVDYFVSAWMSRANSAGADDEFSCGMSLRWKASGGDSAVRYRNAVKSVVGLRKILRKCSFSTIDAITFLERCVDDKRHGVYCDPPFPGPGDRYKFKVDVPFQRRLATAATRFEDARVVMRFYDHPLIRELYPEPHWTWLRFSGRNQANNDTPEVLLLNGPSYQVDEVISPRSIFSAKAGEE